MNENYAVETINLSKQYRGKTVVDALKGVNLSIKRGEIFSLLGPNGAGKTTFQKIISTQLLLSKGDAYVLGHNVTTEAQEVRKHIAVVPQDVETYDIYTPWEYSYYFARLHGASKPEAKELAEAALKIVELWDLRNKPCGSLSGGQKRRAIISSALASKADVFMLDEPTSGLDAMARRNVWTALAEIVREGKTIILSTHIMEEAEMVSGRLAIINKGSVIAQGTPDEINNLTREKFRVVFDGSIDGLNIIESENKMVKFGSKIIIYLRDEDQALEIMKSALKKGLKAEVSPITLEDVFVKMVGGEGIEH